MLSRNLISCLSRRSNNRLLHSSPSIFNSKSPISHTADTYSKDVDSTPPQDPQIHRVDPESEAAQKPHEPPSGEYSRAGTKTKEYQSVDTAGPYDTPGSEFGKLRYGGKESYANEKSGETSRLGDGPEGKESGGRKPEGKQ